jgi:Transcription factor WhiB
MTTTTTARRSRDVAWMSRGACTSRGDLPWTADPENTTVRQLLAMGGVCRACPVLSDCSALAKREKVTAGFWAGRHRDRDGATGVAGPGWATEPLPDLAGLGGIGGAA